MTEARTVGQFLLDLAAQPHADIGDRTLWEGLDPNEPALQRFLAGAVEAGFDPKVNGLALEVADATHYLETSKMASAYMRVARRIGLPYSEVVERWTSRDLAMEIGFDILKSVDDWERCQQCGVADWEVWDDSTRWLENGRWKVVEHSCRWCRELSLVNEGISEQDRKDGARAKSMPRQPGEERVTAAVPTLG